MVWFLLLFHPMAYAFWDAGNRRDQVIAAAAEQVSGDTHTETD